MKYFLIILIILLYLQQTISENIEYDPELSENFLYFAKSTFCPKKEIQDWDCIACKHLDSIESVKVLENVVQGTRAVMGYQKNKDLIFLAFRGSDNIQNWLEDFNFVLVDYPSCPECKIHEGFHKDWLGIQQQVLNYYKNLKNQYSQAKFVVTGHSLGAALATISAISLSEQNITVDYLYTFGAPRPGNINFAQYGHSLLPNSIRVTHYRDPVPHAPLQSQGYRQLPTEVWYYEENDSSVYQVCNMPGVEEDPNCSNSVDDTIWINHDFYLGIYIGCENEMPSKQENNYPQYQNLRKIQIG